MPLDVAKLHHPHPEYPRDDVRAWYLVYLDGMDHEAANDVRGDRGGD